MKNRLLLIFLVTNLMFTVSCKKYDEGPAFSLRTKKARLTGDWVMQGIFKDGTDVTPAYYQKRSLLDPHTIFDKDGRFVGVGNTMTAGSWDFGKKKETLVLTVEPGNTVETYSIVRLTEEEFWVTDTEEASLVTRLRKVKEKQ